VTFNLMEIDLGDGEAGMVEELGNGFEVFTGFHPKHGGGVAEGVNGNAAGIETCSIGVAFEQLADKTIG
jgi:hypothetical protein